MQGVRWSEDDLKAHQARMARAQLVPAASVRAPANDTGSRAKAGDDGRRLGDAQHSTPERSAGYRSASKRPAGAVCRGPESVSRPAAGRSAAATSELMDVTGGERPAANREEEALQIAVAELLDLGLPQGWRWWHTPNQRGTRKPWEQRLLKALGVKAGVQDVTIVGPSAQLVIIELKARAGKLSPAQKDWRDFYRKAGIPWFIARSIGDVIAACQDAGVPLRVRAS